MTQRDAIAHAAHLAIDVIASRIVIDPVAVADIEPIVGTVPPDRVLYEPREDLPEARVELPGINLVSDSCNDVGTVTRPIAAGTIEVLSLEPTQHAGANEKVVNERGDRDHAGTNLGPKPHRLGSRHQHGGQRHAEHFVRNPVDMPKWVDQRVAHSTEPISVDGLGCCGQLGVDPTDQVVVGYVADEQVQGISSLVEPAVPQAAGRQRTFSNVIGLGTGAARLVVQAAVELPVALELWAGWSAGYGAFDLGPRDAAVHVHVVAGHAVRDALMAECHHQPIK